MVVKIRLARRGRKDLPHFHIVVADARAPRDGRFIAKIGSYNPHTAPSSLSLSFAPLLQWLSRGAQPTATVRNLCSAAGVMFAYHLLVGIRKGALTPKIAQERFLAWKKLPRRQKVDCLPKKENLATILGAMPVTSSKQELSKHPT